MLYAVAVIAGISVLLFFTFILKRRKTARGGISPLHTKGCSERSRKLIREEYEIFTREVELFRRKLEGLVEKKPSLKVSEPYRNLLRIWGVVEDIKSEIELYPSGDCVEHFRRKFEFYRKLIRENFEKLNAKG